MTTVPALILTVVLLLALMFVRVPVAFALLISGGVGLVVTGGYDVGMSTVAAVSMGAPGKFVLVVVPMFVAMGVFALHARIAEEGFALASRWFRRIPGSLALASLATCAAFAAVSGSSAATVVSVGRPAMKEMQRHGYTPAVAAGVIGASGTLGILIPPSIVLVIYGVLTGVSIGALLIAGIVPGVLSALIYGLAIVVRARRHPEQYGALLVPDNGPDPEGDRPEEEPGAGTAVCGPVDQASSDPGGVALAEVRAATQAADRVSADTSDGRRTAGFGSVAKIGLLFTIVIGGIYAGWFTVIESAAIAAVTALAMMLVGRRREGWRGMLSYARDGIMESASLSSMVLALLLGASVFTSFLTAAAVPQRFTRFMLGLDVPPMVVVGLLLMAFLVLGMFLDSLSVIVLAVPVAYPVVSELGFDLVWFGILVIKSVEVGLITPPLGVNAFIVAGAGDLKVEDAFRGVLSYVPIDLLTIALFFTFPSLITWLPSQL